MASKAMPTIIACSVLQEEIESLPHRSARTIYLPQRLHRTPQILASSIQKEIDALEPGSTDSILLAYGLCCNGIVGVRAMRGKIIVPRVHDCIGIFLGSFRRYLDEQRKNPGTYYLTPGWIRELKDPLGILDEYKSYLSEEDAEWCMKEELKNYKRIALIHMGDGVSEEVRARALDNARYFGLSYEEICGSARLLAALMRMEQSSEFVVVPHGETIQLEPFTAPVSDAD